MIKSHLLDGLAEIRKKKKKKKKKTETVQVIPNNNSENGLYYMFLWDNINLLNEHVADSEILIFCARNLAQIHCKNYLFFHCFDELLKNFFIKQHRQQ